MFFSDYILFYKSEIFHEIGCYMLINAAQPNLVRTLPYRLAIILANPRRFKLFFDDFEVLKLFGQCKKNAVPDITGNCG